MQGIIYGEHVEILAKTLKLYHTYKITNPFVNKIKDMYRFLPKQHQLVISARSPVEEIKIDGLSIRSLQYNFTPIANLGSIQEGTETIGNIYKSNPLYTNLSNNYNFRTDIMFAILEVGPRRKPKNSYVVDLKIIDAR